MFLSSFGPFPRQAGETFDLQLMPISIPTMRSGSMFKNLRGYENRREMAKDEEGEGEREGNGGEGGNMRVCVSKKAGTLPMGTVMKDATRLPRGLGL